MPIFDRYLLRLFVKVLVVCFISITGLYIVIDTFSNLDEFLGYGRSQGSLFAVLADYYSARVPWFFDRTGGLLALIAAMFAVTWLQRTNELVALQAAGISKGRVVRVLVIAATGVALIASVNRETLIPRFRGKLIRNAQDWYGESGHPVEPLRDNQNGLLINGKASYAKDQRIEKPSFLLDRPAANFGQQLLAKDAYYLPPTEDHPGGYLMKGMLQPDDVDSLPSVYWNQRPLILTRQDAPWLDADSCFVASNVDFQQLAGGNAWRRLAPTTELIAELRNPSLDFGLETRVTIHSRLVQPLLDMTLFFLGLPLVLSRQNRNVFIAAGWCLGIVLLFTVVVMGCQMLGSRGYLLSPAMAAWAPLFIFVPTATALAGPLLE